MKIPKLLFILFALVYSTGIINAQVHLDSIYSASELDKLQEKARESNDSFKLAEISFLRAKNAKRLSGTPTFALSGFEESAKSFAKYKDSSRAYKAYAEISEIHESQNEYIKLIPVYQNMDRFLNDSLLEKKARIQYQLASAFMETEQLDSALFYFDESIRIAKDLEDLTLQAESRLEKANLYFHAKEFKKCLEESKLSLAINAELNQGYLASKNLYVSGMANFELKKFKTAMEQLLEAERLALKTGDRTLLKNIYKDISFAYEELGNYEAAFDYLEDYSNIAGSIFNRDRIQMQNDFNERFFTMKSDVERRAIDQERKRALIGDRSETIAFYSIIVGFITMLFASYFVIRLYQQRLNTSEIITQQSDALNEQKIIELENNLRLETMYSMMEGQEKERERIAKDLHDSLGGLLSTVKLQFESLNINNIENIKKYEHANNLLDRACQEVREISRNLQPSALVNLGLVPAIKDLINRFDGEDYPGIDFQYYNMDEKINDASISINVYRIIQELLYNAIKHAGSSEILVQITRQANELIIMVEDDGIGFEPGKVKKGMGTENISSRVNFLTGELNVHSSKDKGTNVLINIPLPVEEKPDLID